MDRWMNRLDGVDNCGIFARTGLSTGLSTGPSLELPVSCRVRFPVVHGLRAGMVLQLACAHLVGNGK